MLQLFAALAGKERALISKCAAQASSAAKTRDVVFGNPKLHVARRGTVEQ